MHGRRVADQLVHDLHDSERESTPTPIKKKLVLIIHIVQMNR